MSRIREVCCVSLCVLKGGGVTVLDKRVEIHVIKGVQLLLKLETSNGFILSEDMWELVELNSWLVVKMTVVEF